jgi:kynurenine formamidase
MATMQINLTHNEKSFSCDLQSPIDISIPLTPGSETVNCFYAPLLEVSPVKAGDFIGSTESGGPVNFMNVQLNPHGNGTHTECVGHIAKERFTINQCLKEFHFFATLITVQPMKLENGDLVIMPEQLKAMLDDSITEALIIRTLPNDESKLKRHYSGANPPYFHTKAIELLVQKGIQHLLTDLPSVDREQDEGKLLSHKAYWQYPEDIRTSATITELIFVEPKVRDGLFFLNIQITSLEIDASPSKPVIYPLKENNP